LEPLRVNAVEDITSHLDLNSAHRVKQQHKRVNVDFPVWMIESLEKRSKAAWRITSVSDKSVAWRTLNDSMKYVLHVPDTGNHIRP